MSDRASIAGAGMTPFGLPPAERTGSADGMRPDRYGSGFASISLRNSA